MVKSIIKRIIVGVGVALALMFIKGNLMLNVHAMSVYNVTPSSMYMVVGTTQTNLNMTTNSYTGINTSFYGRQFAGGTYDRDYFYWNFDDNYSSNLNIDKPLDIHFILANSNLSERDYQGIHMFIVDHNHNAYSCQVAQSMPVFNTAGTTSSQWLPPSAFTTIVCPNVALSHKTFKVYMTDTFKTTPDTYIGISKLTLYPTGSNQDIVNAVNNNTNATNQVNDTLNDDSIDEENAEQAVEDLDTKLASNSNVSDLLTMPIRMFMSINSQMQGSCSTFPLGSLYGHQLSLPCINLSNLLGSTLFNVIDIILCGMFALVVRKKVVDIFNNITSLKDRGNEFE